MRQKLSDRISCYSPLLSLETFDNGKFLEDRRLPDENFQNLQTKNFHGKVCYHLIHTKARHQKNSGIQEVFLYEMYRYRKTKQVRWKIVIHAPCLIAKFFDTRNFQKHRRVPRTSFLLLRDDFFDGNSWYTPPPLLPLETFNTGVFLKNRRLPLKQFSVLWGKFLIISLPLIHKKFP